MADDPPPRITGDALIRTGSDACEPQDEGRAAQSCSTVTSGEFRRERSPGGLPACSHRLVDGAAAVAQTQIADVGTNRDVAEIVAGPGDLDDAAHDGTETTGIAGAQGPVPAARSAHP